MAKQYIDYIEFDNNEQCPIVRVGCLNCNKTIAQREFKKNTSKYTVKLLNIYRKKKYQLKDGTYTMIPLCDKCAPKNLTKLTKTMHQGWLKEETWKYCTSKNIIHQQKKKQKFNLEIEDPLPLSYFKSLFKNKKILS